MEPIEAVGERKMAEVAVALLDSLLGLAKALDVAIKKGDIDMVYATSIAIQRLLNASNSITEE